jgi:maltose/moltooligosaccharide transporter
MPYAILSSSLPPEQTGMYMGIFNFFITLPEIIVSLALGWVMNALLGTTVFLRLLAAGFS